MCDICTLKCQKCKTKIAIHIADFCTSRGSVKVYCTKHIVDGLREYRQPDDAGAAYPYLLYDKADMGGDACAVIGGKKGDGVIILCSDPNAYGVHLN